MGRNGGAFRGHGLEVWEPRDRLSARYASEVRKLILLPLLLLAIPLMTASAAEQRPATIQEFMEIDGSVRVIAHRGFSGAAPENTLVAIRKAIEVGADMVEVDVTVTADGEVILLHDETLDRTTDGEGSPIETTLEEIGNLDAGSWFAPEFAGERVPTLGEVLEMVKGRILINVEIKSEAVEHGVVPKVASLIIGHGMLDQVVVSSFSPEALRQMKVTEPAVMTASLYNKDVHTGRDPLEIIQEVGSRGFNISGKRLTPAMRDRCHRHGIPVAVYTINEPARMRLLVGMGVDAVFTDHPDWMIAILSEIVAADGQPGRDATATDGGSRSR